MDSWRRPSAFFAVVFSLAFVCCLCCGAASPLLFGLLVASFVVLCGGSPRPLVVASLPPSVVPLRRPGPVSVLVPPSGYLVASCDGPVALP